MNHQKSDSYVGKAFARLLYLIIGVVSFSLVSELVPLSSSKQLEYAMVMNQVSSIVGPIVIGFDALVARFLAIYVLLLGGSLLALFIYSKVTERR